MKMNKLLFFQKRILKKKSFLIILCLVFPIVFFMRFSAGQKSGMLTIALAAPLEAGDITDELQNNVPAINFIMCASEETARNLVTQKKADAAWIFDSDFKARIEKSGKSGIVRPVVSVIQGEDTVFLAYVREILYSKIFPYFSYEAYQSYARKNIPGVTDSELKAQYERFSSVPDLFEQETQNNQNVSASYLLSPLRGMLALWILMCAFAATLYFMQDYENGLYVWFSERNTMAFFLKMVLIPLADCTLIMLLAILSGGISVSPVLELISICLFVLSCALFTNLIRMLTVKKHIFCAAIPMVILISLVLCPIFLKTGSFRAVQFMLPVYYYLNSIYSVYYLGLFGIYTVVLIILNKLIYVIRRQ